MNINRMRVLELLVLILGYLAAIGLGWTMDALFGLEKALNVFLIGWIIIYVIGVLYIEAKADKKDNK